ncbi:hypothetical protein EON71_00240 [bacterium]|nr:MAG: hypothetical protein EON71_00240 [bacterium]
MNLLFFAIHIILIFPCVYSEGTRKIDIDGVGSHYFEKYNEHNSIISSILLENKENMEISDDMHNISIPHTHDTHAMITLKNITVLHIQNTNIVMGKFKTLFDIDKTHPTRKIYLQNCNIITKGDIIFDWNSKIKINLVLENTSIISTTQTIFSKNLQIFNDLIMVKNHFGSDIIFPKFNMQINTPHLYLSKNYWTSMPPIEWLNVGPFLHAPQKQIVCYPPSETITNQDEIQICCLPDWLSLLGKNNDLSTQKIEYIPAWFSSSHYNNIDNVLSISSNVSIKSSESVFHHTKIILHPSINVILELTAGLKSTDTLEIVIMGNSSLHLKNTHLEGTDRQNKLSISVHFTMQTSFFFIENALLSCVNLFSSGSGNIYIHQTTIDKSLVSISNCWLNHGTLIETDLFVNPYVGYVRNTNFVKSHLGVSTYFLGDKPDYRFSEVNNVWTDSSFQNHNNDTFLTDDSTERSFINQSSIYSAYYLDHSTVVVDKNTIDADNDGIYSSTKYRSSTSQNHPYDTSFFNYRTKEEIRNDCRYCISKCLSITVDQLSTKLFTFDMIMEPDRRPSYASTYCTRCSGYCFDYSGSDARCLGAFTIILILVFWTSIIIGFFILFNLFIAHPRTAVYKDPFEYIFVSCNNCGYTKNLQSNRHCANCAEKMTLF